MGPDLIANDGLYSRYFTQFDGQTRYLLRCQVEGTEETDVNGGFVATERQDDEEGRAYPLAGAAPPCCGSNAFPDNFQATKTGVFTREVAGGSINVRISCQYF